MVHSIASWKFWGIWRNDESRASGKHFGSVRVSSDKFECPSGGGRRQEEVATGAYLAEQHAGVQAVQEVVGGEVKSRVKGVEPLRQIFLHGVQVLLARFEGPVGPCFQERHLATKWTDFRSIMGAHKWILGGLSLHRMCYACPFGATEELRKRQRNLS